MTKWIWFSRNNNFKVIFLSNFNKFIMINNK